jgi:hypothetical protein
MQPADDGCMLDAEPGRDAVADFFRDSPVGKQVYDAVAAAVEGLGGAQVRVSNSQVALRRRTAFCWLWLPGRYLHGPTAAVVISVALARRDLDPRWKEVVEVRPGRWMHHLEVNAATEVDEQVEAWLTEAYALAA